MKLTQASSAITDNLPTEQFYYRRRLAELSGHQYSIKIAATAAEIESALRLRFEVFNLELGCRTGAEKENPTGLEFDRYDAVSEHLIVIDNRARKTIGTYRLNSLETVKKVSNFYSFGEFSIEDLPPEVLASSVEVGRACIAREYRSAKVLTLLWKGLMSYLWQKQKRYFFGCCSIFTQNRMLGGQVFCQLVRSGFLADKNLRVEPRADKAFLDDDFLINYAPLELPNLFKIYLNSGAKICGAPILDREFGTIDFFVIFDAHSINGRYRSLFD